MGRVVSASDPDLGTLTYTYDPNGNEVSSADPRGAAGTVYGYDGLNRKNWMGTNSNGSSPLATWSYDSTTSGNVGIGRLTGETFASGPSQSVSGSYAYTYDARGRQTVWNATIAGQAQTFQYAFNDAGQQTSLTYPSGDVVATNYGTQDWLSSATLTSGSTQTTLLSGIQYQNAAGAAGNITTATFGNGIYTLNQGFDGDLRLNNQQVTLTSGGTTEFGQSRSFDAMGNVVSKSTTLPAGTVNEAYCYDEQDRMIWSGSTGTPSCGVGLTAGTLTAANYTQTYAFDVLNRLTTGPDGSGYTYGDATHLDAVTSAPSYTATYDAAGEMTNRNGQVIGYDALNRMLTWQNTANNPTTTIQYAYDGEGQRVWHAITSGGATTTYINISNYEQLSISGTTTTTMQFYDAGVIQAVSTNGTLAYTESDGLGSVSLGLDGSGNVLATALYEPYGNVGYSSGGMPGPFAFTGQIFDHSDLGLAYYNARYYDPQVGQFTSGDFVQGPNRYGYVGGNPETYNDPNGTCVGPSGFVCAAVAGDMAADAGGGLLATILAPEVVIPVVTVVLIGGLGYWAYSQYQASHQTTTTQTSATVTSPQSISEPLIFTSPLYPTTPIPSTLPLPISPPMPTPTTWTPSSPPSIPVSKPVAPPTIPTTMVNPGTKVALPNVMAAKTVVIGETMSRIEDYVAKNGGTFYNPWNNGFVNDQMARNTRWIKDMMREGNEIIDIGYDSDRTDPSDFYQMERDLTKDYPNLRQIEWPGSGPK